SLRLCVRNMLGKNAFCAKPGKAILQRVRPCAAHLYFFVGLVFCGGGHEENLSHLDRKTARFSALAGPCDYFVQIIAFQYPYTADVLLGLQVRSISEEQLTVGLRPQRVGWAQPAGELPDTSSYHFAIERVNLLHHRFVLCGRVEVVGKVTRN